MKTSVLFTSVVLVATLSGLAAAQPMARPGYGPSAGQPVPQYGAPAPYQMPSQPPVVYNQEAVLQEMQRQLNETRAELKKVKDDVKDIEDFLGHQTIGLAVGASTDLNGKGPAPMARVSLKWIFVEYDLNKSIGAGVQPDINLFNRIIWYPITLGAKYYTGAEPYVAPEFGSDRTDITFGTGLAVPIWEGLRIAAFVKWDVLNPWSAYSKAEKMVLDAQGNTAVGNTGIDPVDGVVEDGYNIVESKTSAGISSAYLVNSAYDEALRNPRVQITLEWWL